MELWKVYVKGGVEYGGGGKKWFVEVLGEDRVKKGYGWGN